MTARTPVCASFCLDMMGYLIQLQPASDSSKHRQCLLTLDSAPPFKPLQKCTHMFYLQLCSVCTSMDNVVLWGACCLQHSNKQPFMFLVWKPCMLPFVAALLFNEPLFYIFWHTNHQSFVILGHLHCKRTISIAATNPIVRPLCPPTVMHFHCWSVLWKEAVSVIFLSCDAVHHSGGGQYRQREAGHL